MLKIWLDLRFQRSTKYLHSVQTLSNLAVDYRNLNE